jgi:2-dehydropantoate 2-reductase
MPSLFDRSNIAKQKFAEILIPIAMKKHFSIYPSMLQDLDKGKPCEVDAINGVVCEWGKKYDVPTPVNDRIVEVIKKEQNEGLKPMLANIQYFKEFYE